MIEVITDGAKGRCAFAKENIPRGTIILVELPILFVTEKHVKKFLEVQEITLTFQENEYDYLMLVAAAMIKDNKAKFPTIFDLTLDTRVLSKSELKAYHDNDDLDLRNCFGVVATNSFTINHELLRSKRLVVHQIGSSFNHSCLPNCKHSFKYETGKMIVIANQDIPPGEELTINYLPQVPLEERGKYFKEKFYVECSCDYCVTSIRRGSSQ